MKLKRGVSLEGLVPQMAVALLVAKEEYSRIGAELTITSANDSKHREGSDHYLGRAVDLRTRDLYLGHNKQDLALDIAGRLGPQFICLFEGAGTPNQHIHLAWRPKNETN